MAKRSLVIEELTPDERLQLIEELWESLRQDPGALTLTEAQRRELDRRLDKLDREGPTGLSWDEMIRKTRVRRD